MSINLTTPELSDLKPRITVIGVGGAGGNAVGNMINAKLEGVEFVVANTDAQALTQSPAERRIQMGPSITQGLGAGSRPEVGRASAEEAIDEILDHLTGSHMVFITAGMGGGTGTGGAPVMAQLARDQGILTVGVVTKPFHFEGAHRMRIADAGILEMQQHVDTLIVIPNQNLFRIANEKTTFADAFNMADEVLHSGVRGVTDLMVMPGLINLDFADVRAVMSEMGKAMMGTGEGSGEKRAIESAEAAISNPLLDEVSMKGARGVLINITGGMDLTLFEVDEAANRIRSEVDPDANIIVGSTFDTEMEGTMRVSVVATGIAAEEMAATRGQSHNVTSLAAVQANRRVVPEEAALQAQAASASIDEAAPASIEPEPEINDPRVASGGGQAPHMEQAEEFSFIEERPARLAEEPFEAPQSRPFIPPEPQRPSDDGYAAPREEEVRQQSAPEEPRKRSPGFFERVTRAARGRPEPASPPRRSSESAAPQPRTAGQALSRSQNAPQNSPAEEPKLKVDPAERILPSGGEDQLEIPAFLRRQAN